MRPNRFRQALESKGCAFGHMIMEFGTRGVAQIVEAAGADFTLVDMEHSGFDIDRVSDLMAWFKATTVTPMVRVPQPQYHFLARCLDAGAMGVMIPNVETAGQAAEIVRAVKYAPMGARGVGLGTAHTDYSMPDPKAYLDEANASTVVICQIESPEGVRNAEAIAATPGVDCLWVGHFDLSHAMGIAGAFQDPRFLEALKRVPAVCTAHGKWAGVQPGSMDQAREWWSYGYRVISWRSDIALFRIALADGLKQLREMA